MHPIRFLFVLHDHQPIGNFDDVFEQAYQDSYKPFLDLFESYPSLKIGLHTSGPLMEWLDAHHPDYLDRLGSLVSAGRIEIIGGAFYEPILAMLPAPRSHRPGADLLRVAAEPPRRRSPRHVDRRTRLGTEHGQRPGRRRHRLHRPRRLALQKRRPLRRRASRLLPDRRRRQRRSSVIPGSERLRYVIPFGAPQDTIDYLRDVAERHPGAIAMFADDGEKFGVWPETNKSVYDEGWLRRLFDLLAENQSWIHMATPAEAIDSVPPLGTVYLPEGSYREMTEWVLPPDQPRRIRAGSRRAAARPPLAARRAVHARRLLAELQNPLSRSQRNVRPHDDGQPSAATRSSTTGTTASSSATHGKSCTAASATAPTGTARSAASTCRTCAMAAYQKLIAADNLLDRELGHTASCVEAVSDDFNFDGRPEVQLVNDRLLALIAPHARRPALRARRALDLPQPARHALAPPRSLPPPRARRAQRQRAAA